MADSDYWASAGGFLGSGYLTVAWAGLGVPVLAMGYALRYRAG